MDRHDIILAPPPQSTVAWLRAEGKETPDACGQERARCAKINAAADEIDQLRSLLCEAVTATSWMPDDWKQRAKALGLPVVDLTKSLLAVYAPQ